MKNAPRLNYRNPLDLTRIDYDDIIKNRADGVYVEKPEQARTFVRMPPSFHDAPDDVHLFPPFHEVTVTYPPVFTTSLRNVLLQGFRTVLSKEGFFTNDVGHLDRADVQDVASSLSGSEEVTKLVPGEKDGDFFSTAETQTAVNLEGPVVLLTSAEPGNFGSFLYRDLPKLVNLSNIPHNWRFLAHVPVPAYEQLLVLAGISSERLIRHDLTATYRIEQAIIPGLRTPLAFADEATRGFYEKLRSQCDQRERGRKIYISRHSVSAIRPAGRVMQNEGALIEQLRLSGFDIIEPQFLTAAEQIATFASAELVVGPSGAGLFNVVFCKPGTKVIDIESEPHWIHPHSCLFASSGLHYGIFEGLAADCGWSVHHKPWSTPYFGGLLCSKTESRSLPLKFSRTLVRAPVNLSPRSCRCQTWAERNIGLSCSEFITRLSRKVILNWGLQMARLWSSQNAFRLA
jgi:hypothetical protein